MKKIKYIIGDRTIDAELLHSIINKNETIFSDHDRIMVHSSEPLVIAISLHLAESLGKNLYLCHSFFQAKVVNDYAKRYDINVLVTGILDDVLVVKNFGNPKNTSSSSNLHIFTTGTTGEPKLAVHKWDSIAYASRHASRRLKHLTWLMAYSFTGYAGLQVYFAAQRNDGAICFPALRNFVGTAETIVKHDVKIISATPTYWRMLISAWPRGLKPPVLEQATLGGEVISQDILNLIETFFRPNGLTHVYASTEAGSVLSVSDRLAGFPVDYLESNREIRLRINNDILEIKSPASMEGYVGRPADIDSEGWVATGDRVQISDNRVFFVGRNDSNINIGGTKVLPEEIEEVINQLPEIDDCIVYSKRNPIVGAILAADIKLKSQSSIDIPEIKKKLSGLLPEIKNPQFIRMVEKIEVSENGKKRRT